MHISALLTPKMDAQNDISAWISGIPMITKYWFFAYFLVPLTTRLGLISPISLVLFSDAVLYKFEVTGHWGSRTIINCS